MVEKREIKHQMHKWEREYEEKNDGLVPTHHDKKEDPTYNELKARARKVEAALVLSKAGNRAQRAEEEAEDAKAARALRFHDQRAYNGNLALGHRQGSIDWTGEGLDNVGSMQNLFEETVGLPSHPGPPSRSP